MRTGARPHRRREAPMSRGKDTHEEAHGTPRPPREARPRCPARRGRDRRVRLRRHATTREAVSAGHGAPRDPPLAGADAHRVPSRPARSEHGHVVSPGRAELLVAEVRLDVGQVGTGLGQRDPDGVPQVVGSNVSRPARRAQRPVKAARPEVAPGVGRDEQPPGGEHRIVEVDARTEPALAVAGYPDAALEVDVGRLGPLDF